jgi:FtsZ-binding cell division protein ZapB
MQKTSTLNQEQVSECKQNKEKLATMNNVMQSGQNNTLHAMQERLHCNLTFVLRNC